MQPTEDEQMQPPVDEDHLGPEEVLDDEIELVLLDDEGEEVADGVLGGAVAHFLAESVERQFRGPLPPPEILAAYDEVCPGAADRIITLAEKQSEHRRELEQLTVRAAISRVTRGQWFALIVSLAFGAGAVWLGVSGHEWLGGVIGGTTIIALVAVFITGRRGKSDEE